MQAHAETLPTADPRLQDILKEQLLDYVTTPYNQNPIARRSMGYWFDEHFHNDDNRLHLDRVTVTSRLTGHSFDAFEVNNRGLISQDAAVLLTPEPRGKLSHQQPGTVYADLRVGTWLRDLGDYGDLLKTSERFVAALPAKDRRTVITLDEDYFPEIEFITDTIVRELRPHMPGQDVRSFLGQGEVRYMKLSDLDGGVHNDNTTINPPLEEVWNHVVIHPFLRTGTNFPFPIENADYASFAQTNGGNMRCPTFATSSHVAVRGYVQNERVRMGAPHQSVPHVDGRGLLIYPDTDPSRKWHPMRGEQPQWQTTSVAYAL